MVFKIVVVVVVVVLNLKIFISWWFLRILIWIEHLQFVWELIPLSIHLWSSWTSFDTKWGDFYQRELSVFVSCSISPVFIAFFAIRFACLVKTTRHIFVVINIFEYNVVQISFIVGDNMRRAVDFNVFCLTGEHATFYAVKFNIIWNRCSLTWSTFCNISSIFIEVFSLKIFDLVEKKRKLNMLQG